MSKAVVIKYEDVNVVRIKYVKRIVILVDYLQSNYVNTQYKIIPTSKIPANISDIKEYILFFIIIFFILRSSMI